ncbi:MAG TPA: DUF4232 domain-containing protein [Solirubrobacteraceae bacterium]|nr:DUF4232 domain-containing protein [Solirubrobacteraceae bacterium]
MRCSPTSRCGAALLAGLTALAVAACGSGGSSSASSPAPAAATTASTTTSTSATSSPTTTTTATSTATSTSSAPATAASASSGCTSAHTAVSLKSMGAATGHAGLLLVFRNSGTAACTLSGYPGVNLATAHGHQELQVPRTPQGFMGGLSPQAKVNPVAHLAPGQEAAAVLEGNDFNPKTGGACPHYTVLLVTPPNETRPFVFTRPVSLCDPQIHPVVPGTSGRQGS